MKIKDERKLIEEVVWDSNFFKKKTGRIADKTLLNRRSLTKFNLECDQNKFERVYYFQDTNSTDNFGQLFNNGFVLVDVNIRLESKRFKLQHHPTEVVDVLKSKLPLSEKEKLLKIGMKLARYSRFYRDENFAKRDVKAMYREWFKNSISGKMADYFFVARSGRNPCAIAVFKKLKNKISADLSLMIVVEKNRSIGLGESFLGNCLEALQGDGIRNIEVETQLSNLKAISFYEKLGFRICESEFIFHWEKRDG